MDSLISSPALTLVHRRPCVSSLKIAEHFGKPHDRVLKDIRRVIGEVPPEFGLVNFDESSYINQQGKEQPMFNVFQDGFVILGMGYTGPKAMRMKVAYIAAFNAMRDELSKPKTLPKLKRKALPAAPQPSYQEKCAEAVAGMFDLHSQIFKASLKMQEVFRWPFWGTVYAPIPEHWTEFAKAMNHAISSFMMTATTNVEVAEHLFTAYVAGEKLMHK
jgi:Rha family phage regulatory protein